MEPFIGQISVVAFDYAPRGWALCNGQLLAISTNQALFSILGTTYGGDGRTTFGLPDLRGRAAMGSGTTPLGAADGSESVALAIPQMPSHTHVARAVSGVGTKAGPTGNVWATPKSEDKQYSAANTADKLMALPAGGPVGNGQPHGNMPPMQALNFIIALQGMFPSRN